VGRPNWLSGGQLEAVAHGQIPCFVSPKGRLAEPSAGSLSYPVECADTGVVTTDTALVPTDEPRECPFCAETIKARAVKCRYCGSDLGEIEPSAHMQQHPAAADAPQSLEEYKQRFVCPKCGSRMVDFRSQRKAGWGAAVLASEASKPTHGLLDGLAMLGAARMINQQDLEWHCLSCGKHDLVQKTLGQNGYRRVQTPSGVYQEGVLRDGKWDGPYRFTTADGSVTEEGSFKASRAHGQQILYYRTGAVKQLGNRNMGALNGKVAGWHENGNQSFEEHYANGRLDGEATRWYENGQMKTKLTKRLGVLHGQAIGWHENGNQSFEEHYLTGALHGQVRKWFENGQLRLQGDYQSGSAVGDFRVWYENGQLKNIECYAGREPGPYTVFREDGQVRERGTLVDSKKHGNAEAWYPDGSPHFTATYQDGKMIQSNQWDQNGAFLGSKGSEHYVGRTLYGKAWKRLNPGEPPAPPLRLPAPTRREQ
jgi:antitoxin component YwqK of YwqJK toxin-antitoxin module/predicted RNA-binding Zn-ribbon protein involved in translation (DUF1610 family)